MKQVGVYTLGCLANDVIGMDNEANEAGFPPDKGDLLLPEPGRVVVQDIKKRIILDCGKRQFQDLADKEGENGATTALLRFQMSHIRNGHVIREVKRVMPIRISIHQSRAKTLRAESAPVGIDPLHAA